MKITQIKWHHNSNVTPEHVQLNIRANHGRDLPSIDYKRICICASGPSLKDHIEDIRLLQSKYGFSVASMNGTYNFLIDHGIVPNYYFQIDAREGKNLPFVQHPNDRTTFYIASQCHPEIFDALQGYDVRIWHANQYEGALEAILDGLKPGQVPPAIFHGGANIGHSCLGPIHALGYKIWYLFGYDGSVADSQKHAFDQPQNADEEIVEVIHCGVPYQATPTMAHGCEQFLVEFKKYRDLGIDIRIYSEGLLKDMVQAELPHLYQAEPGERRPYKGPQAKPRAQQTHRHTIVFWKWKGHIPYSGQDVNIMAAQVDRFLDQPCEIVCITDDPEGIDGSVRIVPLWQEGFESGYDWHRLCAFSEKMADIIAPRFVSMDLDTVICGKLDPLFDHNAPFKAWQDPNKPYQYCTALFQMDAGAFPHVMTHFDKDKALRLRHSGAYNGYDQAWISYILPGQPVWTKDDGVLSFQCDLWRGKLPDNARIVNFHGRHNPRDPDVQEACPWIKDYWKI